MSASLVGSEMCIRDRSPAGDSPVGHPSSCSSPRVLCEVQHGHNLTPVSYTHLTLPTICSV
eukprot:10010725-Alexandrium_andersonii.AAC.1